MNRKEKPQPLYPEDSFNERECVASAMECTGLIPALTAADPEAEENEARLYAVHLPLESMPEGSNAVRPYRTQTAPQRKR